MTMKLNRPETRAAFLLLSLAAACGPSHRGTLRTAERGERQRELGDRQWELGDRQWELGDRQWEPTDRRCRRGELPVELGTAGHYVILAKSGISTVPTAAITGDLGVSPAAATYITGFSLTADSTNVFSTSPQVTGKVYAADYASPTPSNLTTAIATWSLLSPMLRGVRPTSLSWGLGTSAG